MPISNRQYRPSKAMRRSPRRGASAIEYTLIASVVSVAVIVVAQRIGAAVQKVADGVTGVSAFPDSNGPKMNAIRKQPPPTTVRRSNPS